MREGTVWASLEKYLLSLHGSSDIESFWKALQKVIQTAIPRSVFGLTLPRGPTLAGMARWTFQLPAMAFRSAPFQAYHEAHSRAKFVSVGDVFGPNLYKSAFYRQYMAPHQCVYAMMLFFWNSPRMVCAMTIMRTKEQGDLTEVETCLLRRLYPQFQTALRRVALHDREHSARKAFEDYLRPLPLPTILLRWNLKPAYQNQAAREFSALWERGAEVARLMKPNAPLPLEILDSCRALRRRWEDTSLDLRPDQGRWQTVIHHPDKPQLRATITLKQTRGITRPHFLVECEELVPTRKHVELSHLSHLSKREQEIARLVCDGGSNQEIADDAGLSLSMVKKHLHSVFHKLEITSRSQLMALMR